MKKAFFTLLTIVIIYSCSSSKKVQSEPMDQLSQADISLTIINPDTLTDYEIKFENGMPVSHTIEKWVRPDVLGFIGDFDRFRIKFTKVEKVAGLLYSVSGVWSWYEDEGFVKNIKGYIYLDSIKLYPSEFEDYDSLIHRTECGIIYATVELNDDFGNAWKGTASYEYDVIEGKYHYSTVYSDSDGYSNNAYKGVMTTKDGEKVCNWGDFRIPGSSKHDIGCGVFSPQGGRGWGNYCMVDEDSILCERDKDWMNMHNVPWQNIDWAYEKVLETIYHKLISKQALTHEDFLALMPQSKNQFWQFWDPAHFSEDGKGRDYYLDEAVMGEMDKGDFEIIEKFLPACWQWSDGGVAEETWEVEYHLWKKYPKQIESLAQKAGYLKMLMGEINTIEPYI